MTAPTIDQPQHSSSLLSVRDLILFNVDDAVSFITHVVISETMTNDPLQDQAIYEPYQY